MTIAKKYPHIAASLRAYYQEELEQMIRHMKIEGGTLEQSVEEINKLADYLRDQATHLPERWPTLLKGTGYEEWEKRQNTATS